MTDGRRADDLQDDGLCTQASGHAVYFGYIFIAVVVVSPYASCSFQHAVIAYHYFEGQRVPGYDVEIPKPGHVHGHKTHYTTSASVSCTIAEVLKYATYAIKQTSNYAYDQQVRGPSSSFSSCP